MIDHLLGRPSSSWKRTQVFLVILFWVWRLVQGNSAGPRLLWLRRVNRALARFTPWQIIVSTLTTLYTIRHLDSILGLAAPEPLARLYSRSYYRSTWIVTGLDAGFATAMSIRPKWLRDICSIIFSAYYVIYANEADEKLRKFRAVCTVEMLRTTWEKMTNPYLRALSYFERPRLPVVKQIILPRPPGSTHKKPITAWLFYARPERELSSAEELILDLPGGGFICMTPQHHEERLRRWAKMTGKPVLALDYGKAPEYPYPWAIEEGFDAYRVLVETRGREIGMSGKSFNMIMSGDSAGGSLVAAIMFKILESPTFIQRPLALVFNYAALDFNFTSWMTPANLSVLRSEQSSGNLAGLEEQKNHFDHRSPLSVVSDRKPPRRKRSWARNLSGRLSSLTTPTSSRTKSTSPASRDDQTIRTRAAPGKRVDDDGELADEEDADLYPIEERYKPLSERVIYSDADLVKQKQAELTEAIVQANTRSARAKKTPIGTSLTMTSRTGFFADRIISPSMMRAMAILYMGPKRRPNFETDYYISPILAPASLLVRFPPVLMTCGEKDPFVDDTVIFAGRIREAKRTRKAEILRSMVGHGQARARFGLGENLTMSAVADGLSAEEKSLVEGSEEEWVDMRIIEGWSHGYLQMSQLIPEARKTIYSIAEWIDGKFKAHRQETGADLVVDADTLGGKLRGVAADGRSRTAGRARSAVSEEDMDDVLVFTPRKRSPPPSKQTVSFALLDGSEPPQLRSSSSSDETQVPGPATPPPSLPSPSPSFAKGGGNRGRPNAGETRIEHTVAPEYGNSDGGLVLNTTLYDSPRPITTETPPFNFNSTAKPNVEPVTSSDRPADTSPTTVTTAAAGVPTGTTGTQVALASGGGFLSEKELLQRRRVEAVYGMGETASAIVGSDGELDVTAPPSPEIQREASELW